MGASAPGSVISDSVEADMDTTTEMLSTTAKPPSAKHADVASTLIAKAVSSRSLGVAPASVAKAKSRVGSSAIATPFKPDALDDSHKSPPAVKARALIREAERM